MSIRDVLRTDVGELAARAWKELTRQRKAVVIDGIVSGALDAAKLVVPKPFGYGLPRRQRELSPSEWLIPGDPSGSDDGHYLTTHLVGEEIYVDGRDLEHAAPSDSGAVPANPRRPVYKKAYETACSAATTILGGALYALTTSAAVAALGPQEGLTLANTAACLGIYNALSYHPKK